MNIRLGTRSRKSTPSDLARAGEALKAARFRAYDIFFMNFMIPKTPNSAYIRVAFQQAISVIFLNSRLRLFLLF
jgi:hypothetical protein